MFFIFEKGNFIQNCSYKFVFNGKICEGILIGQGTESECEEIIAILSHSCKLQKKGENDCQDVIYKKLMEFNKFYNFLV